MIYDLTIPQFVKTLRNLSAIIQKGVQHSENKKFDMEVLLNARLAPDQLNFIRQIQIACDTAKLSASRLTQKEAPSNPDTEKTLPEVQARIASTITYLSQFNEKDFAQAATVKVTTPRWKEQHLTGYDYVLHHVVPNFYFHVTTAYSILRHNGVDIGKKDYLGELPFKN